MKDESPFEGMMLADGFEEAIIGVARPWQNQHKPVAVYSREKCIDILMKRDKMTWEEAEEFFDFNTEGAYVGEQTPIFISTDEQTMEDFREIAKPRRIWSKEIQEVGKTNGKKRR